MLGKDGKIWELLDTEVYSRAELEEMTGEFVNSPAEVHFLMHEEFEPDTDELPYAAWGTSPVNDNFYDGH